MTHLHQPGSRRPMSEINVVPFIDVMLVLLVIFMITAPLLAQGVKVNLPKMEAKALKNHEKEPVIVTVDQTGNFYLNIAEKPSQAITAQTLTYLVTQALTPPANERPVLVRGDKGVNYGKIVEAMVILQQAGAKSIGLMTEKPAKQTS